MPKNRRKVILKTPSQISKMRSAGGVVREILDIVSDTVGPGASTWDLEMAARRGLDKLKATSAFRGYNGFPSVLCVSVNDVVIHGIPHRDIYLKDGDIVSLDFGAIKHGWYADSARTVSVGRTPSKLTDLIRVTVNSMWKGIEQCLPGNKLGNIGWAIQNEAEVVNDYEVLVGYGGHGIGRSLHESPHVPNFGDAGDGIEIEEGMVLAVEPSLSKTTSNVIVRDDGSVVTDDGSPAAHFEHTVAVTKNGYEVLT